MLLLIDRPYLSVIHVYCELKDVFTLSYRLLSDYARQNTTKQVSQYKSITRFSNRELKISGKYWYLPDFFILLKNACNIIGLGRRVKLRYGILTLGVGNYCQSVRLFRTHDDSEATYFA